MFSPVLSRFSKPNSCLLLLFFFSYFHHLSCARSQQEGKLCMALYECGNLTAGFPFWGVARPQPCGHPSLGLHCDEKSNSTSLIISGLTYRVLQINITTSTLKLVRQDFLGPFCAASFSGGTLTPEFFQLLPNYKTLSVYFICRRRLHYLAKFTCPITGDGSMYQNDSTYHDNCGGSFTIVVPKGYAPEEQALNLTKLESVLEKGFDVKLKIDERPCQECKSARGLCAYNVTTQVCCKRNSSSETNCTPMIPSKPSAEDRHMKCAEPFRCGNQKYLNYPFWEEGREECGHPEFKVNCSGDVAEFSISSVRFRILEMNFGMIKLARMDYLNDLCSQYPESATIIQDVLHSDTKLLTFFYNCSMEHIPSNYYIRQLPCKDDTRGKSYLVLPPSNPRDRAILDKFNASCKVNFNIPVSQDALRITEGNRTLGAMKEALDEGFTLEVNSECLRCYESEGACGYSSGNFICYCKDEPHRHTCKKKGISKNAKIGLSFACGFLGATLILGLLLCLYIRRRKILTGQYTNKDLSETTSYSSNNMLSTTPTSTIISAGNHSFLPSMSNLGNGSVYFGVQVFSYEELEEATGSFSRELGDGGFGTVYYGTLKDGRAVAVKRLFERSIKRVEQFKNEIEILRSLKHPNLVILYGCTTRYSRELLLVYEYISNGTLAEHLHGDQAKSRPICWPARLQIAIETASALSFLHSSGIIHRDVKTTNILLDSKYQVKVADFGISRLFPMDQTHISTAPQGTPGYVDPEYYQCYRLNEKSDVYSFGVVLSELISSKEAVDITRHRQEINLANMAVSKIQSDAVHELADLSLGFARDPAVKKMMLSVAELAFRCLQQEREVRPSMEEIVEVLKGIQKEGIRTSPSEVVEIDANNKDDVGLLEHGVPPPLSPETDKLTSSSNTTASSF